MKKDTFYFSHDANARSDEKIQQLLSVYGFKGYGWFWALIEMLREEPTHKLRLKGKYVWNGIAIALLCDCDSIAIFIKDCINEFRLFSTDKKREFFWSESLLRRINEAEVRKQRYADAGKMGAISRWKSGIAITSPSGNDGIAKENDGIAKENDGRKGNERKGKEIIQPLPLKEIIVNLPGWIKKENWDEFMEVRKKLKAVQTDHALKLIIKDLEKLKANGQDPNKIIEESIKNSWKGVFPLKEQNATGKRLSSRELPEHYTDPDVAFGRKPQTETTSAGPDPSLGD